MFLDWDNIQTYFAYHLLKEDHSALMKAADAVIRCKDDRAEAAEQVSEVVMGMFAVNKEVPYTVKYWATLINWMQVVEQVQAALSIGEYINEA